MVGVAASDHLAALRLAVGLVPLDGELVGRLDRLGAAGREEDALEAGRGELGELRRQLDRRRVGGRPVGRERQRRQLRGGGRPDLLAVGVAEVGAVEAGEAVDVAIAEIVVDVATVAADEDRDVLRVEGHV